MSKLTEYFTNSFLNYDINNNTIPLVDEAYIKVWEKYLDESKKTGILNSLKQGIRQLNFPIEKGISEKDAYKSVTRRGINPKQITEAKGIKLNREEDIQLFMHQSIAGKVPVILISDREDFESFIRAITCKNEPKPLPKSMGASMIAGYNNWDRVDIYKLAWQSSNKKQYQSWGEEFLNNLMPNRELYKDRFILLSKGPYSNISASKLGLDEEEWIKHSITIRLEHECNHYFTKRFFGTMQNNMHDELLADYMGITACLGYFEPNWFLNFIGLESSEYRDGARLQNYLGTPQLDGTDFLKLQDVMRRATDNVAAFDQGLGANKEQLERTLRMLALSQFSLDELANKKCISSLIKKHSSWKKIFRKNNV